MSDNDRFPRHLVLHVAEDLVTMMQPACRRIDIAGSLRRQTDTVGDIEIVVKPRMTPILDLLGEQVGEESHLDLVLDDLVEADILQPAGKDGHKYKRFVTEIGIKLDLWIVTPPGEYGWLFLLRTGPKSFNQRMVTPRSKAGLMPSHLRSKDGAIRNRQTGEIVPTPTEADVFELFEMDPIPPAHRQ